MLDTIAIVVAVLFGALLVYAATRPDLFHVRRSISIKASPERIFALINDFHNWDAWSPYEKMDPAMKRIFHGTHRGNGAVYEWESESNKPGTGRMEIIESSPQSKIVIQLDLAKPLETINIVEFTLASEGDETIVIWDMHGPNPYIGKLMGIFYDRDSMVGKDFEQGLINLKTIAER